MQREPFADMFKAHLRAQAPGKPWYRISAAADDTTEIRIYDIIDSWWGIGAKEFADELDQVTTPKILVAINSLGGSVFESIAIYNALRLHNAEVTTRVDGIAASGASLIAQAGDTRHVVTSGQLMIHNAWFLTIGDATDHLKSAELLAGQDDRHRRRLRRQLGTARRRVP